MYEYRAEVVRVIDGDTVVLDLDLGFYTRTRVTTRLLGVDTAETYGVSHDTEEYRDGKEQAQFVREWLAKAGSLVARTEKQGKYGRWLAEIENSEGEVLNERLIEEFDVAYE
ncbi:micrococcal nuclease [Halorubrum phage HRTV-17]|uniref:Micrococcal nuclease n=1 Tax=Halorubrum phage HRTV-17 TaxID=2877997 RepID=A0AAE8XSV4_9CAUD|nr:micrococcal nuclease [Halorubrum phage HRTV-17]